MDDIKWDLYGSVVVKGWIFGSVTFHIFVVAVIKCTEGSCCVLLDAKINFVGTTFFIGI